MIVSANARIDDDGPFTALNRAFKPFSNLQAGRFNVASKRDGGGFNHPSRWVHSPVLQRRLALRLISFLDTFRCIRNRIIYGDQALFVRRALFEQLGGFPNRPILEDVAFCERLIAVTTPLLLSPPVVTDARKFLKMGVWRSFLRVLLIILYVEFRLPVLPRAFFQDVR